MEYIFLLLNILNIDVILLSSCGRVPWSHVDEGGGRADAEHPEQEQQLLRGVDPKQHQACSTSLPFQDQVCLFS